MPVELPGITKAEVRILNQLERRVTEPRTPYLGLVMLGVTQLP